ncbi:MAG: methylated-DNA--[protein]-cysteine S-methyltransferase [Acidobacteriaceae bacterium]
MEFAQHIFTSTKNQPPRVISIARLNSSPIGPMWVAVSILGLVAVDWDIPQANFVELLHRRFHAQVVYDGSPTHEPLRQISEYLAGKRKQFSSPIDLSGMSSFQVEVLKHTFIIPYGQTRTYKEIAIQVGNPRLARAVGRVEATNPIPIVIPCHRVLGSDGSLHGYGGPGGIKLKAWLLELEGAFS